ncbi:MAG: FtsW/RodA/SpoVE family cell cycle protein [Prevotellaceae bacterium]|jgi:cell division protein FtsW|nr:FtsW/RodA/SpoVE family cell cycle protein [Prevotellaceae bacterium]
MKLLPIRFMGDKKIWILLLLLAAISILSVYSSTYRQTMKTGNLTGAISRHVWLLFVGFVVIYFMHLVPLKYYRLLVPIALLFVIICLTLVFFVQGEAGVAKRWLFSRSFQPSDVAKVVMVVYMAKVLSDGFGGSTKQFIYRAIIPLIIVCGLIITAHTSNVMIIGGTSVLMIFMGASNRRYQIVSALLVFVVITVYLFFYKDIGRGETGANRIKTWIVTTFSPGKKTETAAGKKTKEITGYEQARTAKYAIVSGGFFRIAPGRSVYRKTLSEAHNDYIFAMIVEEYGLLGGISVIAVYLMLFYRVLQLIKKCRKMFTSLLLSGLLISILVQTFIHIGVSVGGIPVTGQNLPMISTGGTSIIITCIAFGMILAVSRAIEESKNSGTVSRKA